MYKADISTANLIRLYELCNDTQKVKIIGILEEFTTYRLIRDARKYGGKYAIFFSFRFPEKVDIEAKVEKLRDVASGYDGLFGQIGPIENAIVACTTGVDPQSISSQLESMGMALDCIRVSAVDAVSRKTVWSCELKDSLERLSKMERMRLE